MRRRKFIGSAALLSTFAWIRPGSAAALQAKIEPAAAPVDDPSIDPYFLDPGEIPEAEQASIADHERYLDRLQQGKNAISPRGGRPRRAPSYRFLYWTGDIDDPEGRFVGPLSVKPTRPDMRACELNAQILGFRASSEDWKGNAEQGTLTVEFRARESNEKMTWLFVQQFDLFEGGVSNLGMEYVAQRDELPTPVVLQDSVLDVRIQLMRKPKQGGGFLRKVLKVAGVIVGLAPGGSQRLQNVTAAFTDVREQAPAMRLPKLAREGVALTQAMFGEETKEKPLWCSAFNSYSLSKRGGRMKLVPGIWVAIDEAREVDMRGVSIADVGGRVVLARDGEPLDANYLILDFQVEDCAS